MQLSNSSNKQLIRIFGKTLKQIHDADINTNRLIKKIKCSCDAANVSLCYGDSKGLQKDDQA